MSVVVQYEVIKTISVSLTKRFWAHKNANQVKVN